jgi:hypothetical protein
MEGNRLAWNEIDWHDWDETDWHRRKQIGIMVWNETNWHGMKQNDMEGIQQHGTEINNVYIYSNYLNLPKRNGSINMQYFLKPYIFCLVLVNFLIFFYYIVSENHSEFPNVYFSILNFFFIFSEIEYTVELADPHSPHFHSTQQGHFLPCPPPRPPLPAMKISKKNLIGLFSRVPRDLRPALFFEGNLTRFWGILFQKERTE